MSIARLLAKIEHFETLASRAAYQAACATNANDRDSWEALAERYDARAADYREAIRVAA